MHSAPTGNSQEDCESEYEDPDLSAVHLRALDKMEEEYELRQRSAKEYNYGMSTKLRSRTLFCLLMRSHPRDAHYYNSLNVYCPLCPSTSRISPLN